jgi:hypothetical protein
MKDESISKIKASTEDNVLFKEPIVSLEETKKFALESYIIKLNQSYDDRSYVIVSASIIETTIFTMNKLLRKPEKKLLK